VVRRELGIAAALTPPRCALEERGLNEQSSGVEWCGSEAKRRQLQLPVQRVSERRESERYHVAFTKRQQPLGAER